MLLALPEVLPQPGCADADESRKGILVQQRRCALRAILNRRRLVIEVLFHTQSLAVFGCLGTFRGESMSAFPKVPLIHSQYCTQTTSGEHVLPLRRRESGFS